MLAPLHLRDLLIDPARHPRGQPHLSAASGLVRRGEWLYVVADDEHHLGVIDLSGDAPVRLVRLLEADLPADARERKRRKPDLEALALLPSGLLALGSGSKPTRERGVLLPLGEEGSFGSARVVDLSSLFAPLRQRFVDLNIEGAFVQGGDLCLLQRGNKGHARNACIRYALDAIVMWLAAAGVAVPSATRIDAFDLGQAAGIPFGFTDGAALPGGGWVFSAVAEDTDDSYRDGPCAASALGVVSPDGKLVGWHPLAGSPKVEGMAVNGPAQAPQLLMVTDADDPACPSRLLACALP